MPPSAGPIGCVRLDGHGRAGSPCMAVSAGAMFPDCPHSIGGPSHESASTGRPRKRPLIKQKSGWSSTGTPPLAPSRDRLVICGAAVLMHNMYADCELTTLRSKTDESARALSGHRPWYITGIVSSNASRVALRETVDLMLIRILEDNPRAIGSITLGSHNIDLTVIVSDPKVLHRYNPRSRFSHPV